MKHVHWHYTVIGIVLIAAIFYGASKDTLYRWYWATKHDIVHDLQTLDAIFKRIHDSCNIVRIDGVKQSINFLTVEKFAGSEVGPLHLAHPEKWQGPYLQYNLATQGKEYQIVRDKNGFFIAPGDGVKLASGKTIGIDIVLNERVDIAALVSTELQFNGLPLAIPLSIQNRFESEYALDDADEQLS